MAMRLSPTMQTALTGAYLARRLHDGVAVLDCHPQTARALVTRRLATPDPDHGHVLNGDGEATASSLIDRSRPHLQADDLVTYHGSLTSEHGREFIVLCADRHGRYALLSTDDGEDLEYVRRTSLTYTGESALTRHMELVKAADLPHPADVQVASGLAAVNAYRRALWQIRLLPPQVRLAHGEYTSYAKAAAGSRRASVREIVDRRRRQYETLAAELRQVHRALPGLRARAEQASPAAAARARLSIVAREEATAAEQRRYERMRERAAAAGWS